MKLWQKSTEISIEVEKFTIGKDRELDLLLAQYDVWGSMAHAIMLHKIGLLTNDEKAAISKELREIHSTIENGTFTIEPHIEDVHSQIELLLTRKLGETGKRIHTGRSRNDQVLVDIKLFTRDAIREMVTHTHTLFYKLIQLSDQHKETLLPGYTHLQMAMPSSFGLWFGAYAESLADDLMVMQAAYKVVNRNPLGSGAGYGSSFPLDRELTSQLLGFNNPNFNVVYAQMSRGKSEKLVSTAMASIAATLGRMAMDICLYMNQNFGFISFPENLTTGSSIMPHKKNPDVFELIRAKCNKLQALPNELTLIMANLPSGYHRDMQLIKESFFPAISELNSCLTIMNYMLGFIEVKTGILDDPKYKYLYSVEAVNALVLEGVPFREAYRIVGKDITNENFERPEIDLLKAHTHTGSIGNLANDKIVALFESIIVGFEFGKADEAISQLMK